jgi:aminoglycoside phosphotransferase (APT) family kinase protein
MKRQGTEILFGKLKPAPIFWSIPLHQNTPKHWRLNSLPQKSIITAREAARETEAQRLSSRFYAPTALAIETILNTVSRKQGWQLRLLGGGASSVAWQADNGDEHWIVRAMSHDNSKPVSYPQEFAVMRQLYAAGFSVPEPLYLHEEVDFPIVAFPWMISRRAEGEVIKKAALPKAAAEDLGRLLAFLHAIPAEGWGWLHLRDGCFVGNAATPLDGARERWQANPIWPLDTTSLEAHPLSYNANFFTPTLKRHAPDLLRAASLGKRALCHSDLHREHIYLNGDNLAALIDFGDICLLPPAWDFAIAARYYGWPAVVQMLATYDAENAEALIRQALALGVIVALYKFNRQYRSQAPILLRAQTLYFLQNTLEHWLGRPIEK